MYGIRMVSEVIACVYVGIFLHSRRAEEKKEKTGVDEGRKVKNTK